jgi:serine/threonine-protein kinase HipA
MKKTAMAEVVSLDVRLHGSTIGLITRLPNDQNIFTFDSAYVDDTERAVLSLSFKDSYGTLIADHRPTQTRLLPFFSNLLPEDPLRSYLAGRARVKPEREFFLIWALGADLPGALEIVAHNGDPAPGDEEPTQLKTADSANGALRFSLAGVQLKFSAVQRAKGGLTIPTDGAGGSWIVKLPSERFAGVPENEFAMMELARHVGIKVPETQLIAIKEIRGLPSGVEIFGDKAFAIKRFDRTRGGAKVHIEDFAQVFGVYPSRKYDNASYRNIAQVLWIETGEEGTAEFMRRLVFNALIGNADMHLKNWSLIYPDTRTAEIAPAYDFVSTIAFLPDEKMALNFVDSKAFASLTRDQFVRFANKAGLPEKVTIDTVEETVRRFAEVWKRGGVQLEDKTHGIIERHLRSVPIWRELRG